MFEATTTSPKERVLNTEDNNNMNRNYGRAEEQQEDSRPAPDKPTDSKKTLLQEGIANEVKQAVENTLAAIPHIQEEPFE